MFRTFVSLVSLVLLGQLMICVQPAYANSKAEEHLPFAEKVRASIAELGIGKDARVTVKLKDKTKIAGYISEVNEHHFAITDSGTGTSTSVTYSSVSQARGRQSLKRSQDRHRNWAHRSDSDRTNSTLAKDLN